MVNNCKTNKGKLYIFNIISKWKKHKCIKLQAHEVGQ